MTDLAAINKSFRSDTHHCHKRRVWKKLPALYLESMRTAKFVPFLLLTFLFLGKSQKAVAKMQGRKSGMLSSPSLVPLTAILYDSTASYESSRAIYRYLVIPLVFLPRQYYHLNFKYLLHCLFVLSLQIKWTDL